MFTPAGEHQVPPSSEVVRTALADAIRLHDEQLLLLAQRRHALAIGDHILAGLIDQRLDEIRDRMEPLVALSDLANGR